MKLLRVPFNESAGLIRDISNSSVPPPTFTDGENFAMVDGAVVSFNGSTNMVKLSGGTKPTKMIGFTKDGLAYYILMCQDSIWANDSISGWGNISSAAYALNDGDEFLWSYCNEGQILVVNNPQIYPEYWPSAAVSTILAPLPFSPTETWEDRGIRANVIRSHKNFLFALNILDGSDELQSTFRWSTAADNGQIPATWDESDLSAIAGVQTLQGNYGAIIDGMTQRDSFVIYSEFGINILDYIGGEFIWSIRELTSAAGLLSKDCVVAAENIHYFISQGDIMMHDGNKPVSLIHNKCASLIRPMLASASAKRSFVRADYARKEIWFCIVGTGYTMPSLALIYNYASQTLSTRKLYGKWSDIIYAPLIQGPETLSPLIWRNVPYDWKDSGIPTWGTVGSNFIDKANIPWDTSKDTWDTSKSKWKSTNDIPVNFTMLGIDPSTGIISSLTTQDGTSSLDTFVMHESFGVEGTAVAVTLLAAYPEVECRGTISIQVGAQYSLGAPILWQAAVNYDPNTKSKISLRSTGLFHSWKISSNGVNDFKLSAISFGYEVNGVR